MRWRGACCRAAAAAGSRVLLGNDQPSIVRLRCGDWRRLEVEVLEQLGIGKCKLCLQTPVGTCKDPSELVGKRIVTSFPNLTKNYFAKLEGTTADEITTDVRYV